MSSILTEKHNSSSIEDLWYKEFKKYYTTNDVISDSSLINFKKDKKALFCYIHLQESWLRRIPNSISRRLRKLFNHIAGSTMGLMNVHCPSATLNLLNGISKKIMEMEDLKKPFPFLVTSILRTVEHQRHLQTLGYPAVDNSSHCNGYAADIEFKWLKENRHNIYICLKNILFRYKEMNIISLIEYDSFYHICLNPKYIDQFLTEDYI